jgi:transposase
VTSTITLSADEYEALLAERERLAQQLRVITVERDLVKERLDAYLRRFFAAKSEARANPAQRDLFLNEAEALAPKGATVAAEAAPEAVEAASHSRKKRGRKPIDPHLPREIVRHELPEAERTCAHDGARLVEIGTDISEQLDIIPQQVRVIQHHRIKYACPCCDEGIRSPRHRCASSPRAWVVTAKYLRWPAAVPATRSLEPFRRRSVAQYAGGQHGTRGRSRPAHHQFTARPSAGRRSDIGRRNRRSGPQGIRANRPKQKLPLGTDDRVRAADSAVYLCPGRGGNQAQPLYQGIKAGAALMSDGYEVYNAIAATHGVVHLGCWAHAGATLSKPRRPYPRLRGTGAAATQFIAAMGELYAIESRAKELSPELRGQLHLAQS